MRVESFAAGRSASRTAVWVAASPQGRYAAVVGGRGEVVVVDTTTGALVRPPVAGNDDTGNMIAYSADGGSW